MIELRFPLTFEEFIEASGVLPETLQELRVCFNQLQPVPELMHQTMMKHFQRYLIVGGMPAAVLEYVSSLDISRVTEIQRNIIELYKLDFTNMSRNIKS